MKNYYLLLFAILFVLIPISAVRPMTSLFAETLGASMIEIGVITSFYSILPIFIAVITGRFIDRLGEKLPLLIGAAGVAVALSLPFLVPKLFMLYICLILLGGSQFLVLVAVQNGITKSSPSSGSQDKAIGTFSLFTSIANTIGPLLGGILSEQRGFQETFLMMMLISLLALLCGFLLAQKKSEVQKEEEVPTRLKEILSIVGMKRILIISMINLAAIDLFYIYYPLFAHTKGYSPSKIGMILMFMALANFIARFFLPVAVLKFGRVKILFVFLLIGGVAYCLIPVFDAVIAIIIIVMFLGAGLGMSQPLTILLSYQLAPKNHTAEVLGIRLAGNRLSQVASPIIFAFISTLIGLGWIFVIKAAVLGFGAFLALKLKNEGGEQAKEKSKGEEFSEA